MSPGGLFSGATGFSVDVPDGVGDAEGLRDAEGVLLQAANPASPIRTAATLKDRFTEIALSKLSDGFCVRNLFPGSRIVHERKMKEGRTMIRPAPRGMRYSTPSNSCWVS